MSKSSFQTNFLIHFLIAFDFIRNAHRFINAYLQNIRQTPCSSLLFSEIQYHFFWWTTYLPRAQFPASAIKANYLLKQTGRFFIIHRKTILQPLETCKRRLALNICSFVYRISPLASATYYTLPNFICFCPSFRFFGIFSNQ